MHEHYLKTNTFGQWKGYPYLLNARTLLEHVEVCLSVQLPVILNDGSGNRTQCRDYGNALNGMIMIHRDEPLLP